MIKKSISMFGVLVLACFSFYYTDRAIDIVKKNDPIMKKIMEKSKDYYVEPVNASIEYDELKSGINGKKVDINSSYKKMKKINYYNESMLVFDEVIPDLTYLNSYDKYIVGTSNLKNKIALIFKIDDSSYIDKLNDILLDKNSEATFFIDGSIIENNTDKILELVGNGYEIENLGYDGKYTIEMFGWTNNLISSITNKDTKYCYTDYKNSDILDLCSKYHMHTIKPTISVNSNYPFKTVKSTKGVYSFWVKPVPAEKEGIAKTFPLSIEVKAEGYNDVVYHFEAPICQRFHNQEP